MFVINIVAVCCLTLSMCVPFWAIIPFFRVPLNVLVPTPGGTRTPGWESLHQLDTTSQLRTENSRKNPVTH